MIGLNLCLASGLAKGGVVLCLGRLLLSNHSILMCDFYTFYVLSQKKKKERKKAVVWS